MTNTKEPQSKPGDTGFGESGEQCATTNPNATSRRGNIDLSSHFVQSPHRALVR